MVNKFSRRTSYGSLVVALVGGIMIAQAVHWLGSADADEGPDWHKGLPQQYESKYLVHDDNRPKPAIVASGAAPGAPPSDAIILFDGKSLDAWEKDIDPRKESQPAKWTIENGYAELNNSGSIRTKRAFGDCQFHIEWANPAKTEKKSQGRGNSGIFFMKNYEVQILDNYDNETYADGYAGSLYGQRPPLANACRKPGEWQVYDIVFRAPRFDGDKLVERARATVFHNGVVVQNDGEFFGRTVWRGRATYDRKAHGDTAPISLQDHGDKQKMRYRNIWVRPLDLSPTD